VPKEYLDTKEAEVIEGWRKLYNEELHNLYDCSYKMLLGGSNQKGWDGMGWVGHIRRTRNARKAYTVLVGKKTEGKITFERPKCRWEDNIKRDLKEIGVRMWIRFIRLGIQSSDGLL
jgi:hypothetical protein